MVPDKTKIENIKSNNKTDDILNKSFNSKQLINFKQKFISPMLSKLNSEEKNSYLDIMLDELSLYKYKKSENLSRNKNVNFTLSKNLIYNYLEKYLLEVTYITDKEKRKEKINKVYEWYKGKLKLEKDVQTITYKTYNNKNEIDEKEYFLVKKRKKLNALDLDKSHRNLELIRKKMLNDYKRKQLSKPFCALKKSISSQILPIQEDNTVISSTNFSLNDFNKTNEEIKEKTDININININPENFLTPMNKGIKFSYSYLSPNYDLNDIYIENQMTKEKNKIIAMKRNQEELNEKLKEFSLFRARFKANSNNKLEKKRLINFYVNKNKLSSYLLKKYKLKEQEKEKNENSETKLIIEPKESLSIDKRRKSINLSFLFLNKNSLSQSLLSNKKNEKENNDIINSKNSDNNIIRTESSENISSSKKERRFSHGINGKDKDKPSFIPGESLFKLSMDKSGDKNTGKNTTNFIKKFKLSFSRKFANEKNRKTSIKKKSLNILSRLINLKTFSGRNNKIKTNQIQNLENDSKKIKSTNDTYIKEYATKIPQEIINSDLLNKTKEEITYKQLCKINANPSKIDDYSDIKQRTKMIILNKNNMEEVNKGLLTKIKKRNNFEKLNDKYFKYKNNLLSMRQSMSTDKKIEYQNLVDKIKLKNLEDDSEYADISNNNLNEIESMKKDNLFYYRLKRKKENQFFSLLKALVNPNDNSNYSRYYLPRNGSMLLSKDRAKKIFKKYLF